MYLLVSRVPVLQVLFKPSPPLPRLRLVVPVCMLARGDGLLRHQPPRQERRLARVASPESEGLQQLGILPAAREQPPDQGLQVETADRPRSRKATSMVCSSPAVWIPKALALQDL